MNRLGGRSRRPWETWLLAPAGVLYGGLIVVPLALILWFSLADGATDYDLSCTARFWWWSSGTPLLSA